MESASSRSVHNSCSINPITKSQHKTMRLFLNAKSQLSQNTNSITSSLARFLSYCFFPGFSWKLKEPLVYEKTVPLVMTAG